MRIEVVAERIGKSKRTILRWVDQRKHGIPKPTTRNAAMVAWPDALMTRWLRRYRSQRGGTNGAAKPEPHAARRRVVKGRRTPEASRVEHDAAADVLPGRAPRDQSRRAR